MKDKKTKDKTATAVIAPLLAAASVASAEPPAPAPMEPALDFLVHMTVDSQAHNLKVIADEKDTWSCNHSLFILEQIGKTEKNFGAIDPRAVKLFNDLATEIHMPDLLKKAEDALETRGCKAAPPKAEP